LQRRAEGQCQAGQGTVKVERRGKASGLGAALLDAAQVGHQRIERIRHDKNDASPTGSQQRHVACKLNRVAEPLVRINKKGLSRDLFVPEPDRLEELRMSDRNRASLPARFTSGPTRLKLLRQQLHQRTRKFGCGIVGVERLKVIINL